MMRAAPLRCLVGVTGGANLATDATCRAIEVRVGRGRNRQRGLPHGPGPEDEQDGHRQHRGSRHDTVERQPPRLRHLSPPPAAIHRLANK